MMHTLKSLQIDGLIVRVIDNNTSHEYEIGDYLIVCQRLSASCDYTYAIGTTKIPQYFSAKDIEPVEMIEIPDSCNTDIGFKKALTDWFNLGAIPHIQFTKPRTQKGRGLRVLVGLKHTNQVIRLVRKPVSMANATLQFPLFARPCPVKPRHGFVDSRKVESLDELNAVITETNLADPHGEVLLMKPIKATYSGIVTDNTVTIGAGTDGATSGKKSVAIACMSDLRKALTLKNEKLWMSNGHGKQRSVRALRYATVRPDHAVFLETVGTHIVQLRTGPAVDYTQNWYSPVSSMTILQVETICDDPPFLVYEARLTELSNSSYPNESIVIHLPGQTLTSHYAVQAISKGFTVCTEFETPKRLTCKTFTARKLILVVNEQYRKSVLHARQVSAKVTPTKSVLAWSVSVIQGLGATDKTLESVKLIVAAGSILARTGIALCLGEHRHFWGFGPGRYRVIACAPTYPPFEMISCLSESVHKPDRESVYANVFELDWNDITHWQRMQGIMLGVEYDFNLESWSSSYGGPKWGQCAQATTELIQAMMPFLLMTENKPGLGDWCNQVVHKQLNAVMAAANKLITLSHNSGKCLTKLISQSELTKISFGYTGIHLATSPLTWKLVK